MSSFFLLINKNQITSVWDTLQIYPIQGLSFVNIIENCIEIQSNLEEDTIRDIMVDYFLKIGYHNTFTLFSHDFDYHVI